MVASVLIQELVFLVVAFKVVKMEVRLLYNQIFNYIVQYCRLFIKNLA